MLSSILFSKSQFTVILGNFNARSILWLNNSTNLNGTLIDSLTATLGFKHLISDATHILALYWFTDQPNYVIDSGNHTSLNKNCHYEILFCKLNLQVQYPPPYQRLVWNFEKSNNDANKRAIEFVNWNSLFSCKNVHEQVVFSTKH